MNQHMMSRLRKVAQADEDRDFGSVVIIEVRDCHHQEDSAAEIARLEGEGRRITERTPVIVLRRFSAATLP